MRKVYIAGEIGVFSLALAMSSPAAAAPSGQVVLSVERLFGVSRIASEISGEGLSSQSSVTSLSLFGTPFLGPAYSSPRLAADYIADFGLSVGAGMGYQRVSAGDAGQSGDPVSAFVAAPRVGYFALLTPQAALWPRGGVTYRQVAFGSENSTSFTAISAELPLILMVADGHVGLFAMPHVDLGMAGGNDVSGFEIDTTVTELGLQFGLSVFL
jgi:hypothetical protein